MERRRQLEETVWLRNWIEMGKMIVGEVTMPLAKADLSAAQEVEAMERIPRSQWSAEPAGDKSPYSVPMMIYRDAFKSSNQDSPVRSGQKVSASDSHLSLPSDFDMGIRDTDLSSSSSASTLKNSWENASVSSGNSGNMNVNEELESGNSVDQFSKRISDAHVRNPSAMQNSSTDSSGMQHKQVQQKDLPTYPNSVSPVETSSGISVNSVATDASSSSVESRTFYEDKSLSKNSTSDSSASSCVLSVANFTASSASLTPGLIHTAYSRLKDRDMLYRKRIKELEKEVKKVPILEMNVATLKEENHLLLLQLKFCSGKTRSVGFGDNFPYNEQMCRSPNSDSNKHLNNCNKSSGSVPNSSGSSVVTEIPNSQLSSGKNSQAKCLMPLESTVPSQSGNIKSVRREVMGSHVSTESSDVKQISDLNKEIDQQSRANMIHKVPDLSAFTAQCDLGYLDSIGKQDKFCVKCPRCSFLFSTETLMTNMRKDQNIRTDPSLFTFDRSTQTPTDKVLKNQSMESVIQNLGKILGEAGINDPECMSFSQVLAFLQSIVHCVSDDSKRGCSAAAGALTSSQFHSKLKDFSCSSSSSGISASDAVIVPVKTESATFETQLDMDPDLTDRSKCSLVDSCFEKNRKGNIQLNVSSMKKTKTDTLDIQNSNKGSDKNVKLDTTGVNPGLMPLCESVLKTKKELRSMTLNHMPRSPILPSSEERRAALIAQNEGPTSSSSEFVDYDTESFNIEDEGTELIKGVQSKNGHVQICDGNDSGCNDEAKITGALNGNNRSIDGKCSESQDVTSEDEKRSGSNGSSCHTLESKEGCHSPYLETEPSGNFELTPHIALEQRNALKESVMQESQVFDIKDTQEELVFPDEIKAAFKQINEYLLNPKENFDRKSLREPVDLVKKHWFGIMCSSSASPSLLQQYLSVVSQYSSVLARWMINVHDAFGNSILHFAVANRKFAMLDVLLQTGMYHVNKRNKAGFTGVMLASVNHLQSEFDRQIIKKLLQLSDLNARSYVNGETALTLAAGHGMDDMVELLLEAGADVNVQDNDGSTALMYAVEHGFLEIARRLLVHPSCDLSLRDDKASRKCKQWLKASGKHPLRSSCHNSALKATQN